MATKSIAWNTGGGNITLTYTGQGNGSIVVSSDVNKGAARSQTIVISTTQGGVVTKNITVSQAACPFPVGDVRNYSYTGTVQSVLLPAGSYKLQCWGAQGGSNAADSTYGITAQAGGKGGYSEGVLTLSQDTTVYIFVGGQGASSGNGGWNGGGGGTGTCTLNEDNNLGYTKVGCGGGATDIALVTSDMSSYYNYRTNRSGASLLSRMIVAGGGSGGAMAYQKKTAHWETVGTASLGETSGTCGDYTYTVRSYTWGSNQHWGRDITFSSGLFVSGTKLRISYVESPSVTVKTYAYFEGNALVSGSEVTSSGVSNRVLAAESATGKQVYPAGTFTIERYVDDYVRTISQVGFAGGGATGCGYADRYKGTQSRGGAGTGSYAIGYGSSQRSTNMRFHAGLGGAGWMGGGCTLGDDDNDVNVKGSGGGSGFVNISANAQYRPSGYTGLQLDSGTTTDGEHSFEAPGGGTETGHSGNGYARITRLS